MIARKARIPMIPRELWREEEQELYMELGIEDEFEDEERMLMELTGNAPFPASSWKNREQNRDSQRRLCKKLHTSGVITMINYFRTLLALPEEKFLEWREYRQRVHAMDDFFDAQQLFLRD